MVVAGIYLHTGILFVNKGFVRTGTKSSLLLEAIFPGGQAYTAVPFSSLEVLLGTLL